MMVNGDTYVPALKWRQAEYQALLRLSDEAKEQIVPLLIVPSIEFDFEDGEPIKTPQKHLEKFPRRYREKWKLRPAWIDIDKSLHKEIMDDGLDAISHIFSELRQFGSAAIPVVSLDYEEPALDAIALIAREDDRGVALRARVEHLMQPNFNERVDRLLQRIGVSETQVDFILDLAAPEYEPYDVFSQALISILRKVSRLPEFRSFVMIGTAFPSSLAGLSVPGGNLERRDWIFYKTFLAALPQGIRKPAFGDYTVVNPTFAANFDYRMVKPAGKLIYTTSGHWVARKGGSFRDHPEQMYQHCLHIVRCGIYRGADYSNGDDYIMRCARREKGAGPSTLTRWKEIGINHHITHVLEDLSNLVGGA